PAGSTAMHPEEAAHAGRQKDCDAARRAGLKFQLKVPQSRVPRMPNLLEQAINADDGDLAAKIIQDALGIESDDVANYVFPKTWPADRDQRARIIGEWLQTEARFLASEALTDVR